MSTRMVRYPRAANSAARLTADVDLATPPFWLTTATLRPTLNASRQMCFDLFDRKAFLFEVLNLLQGDERRVVETAVAARGRSRGAEESFVDVVDDCRGRKAGLFSESADG